MGDDRMRLDFIMTTVLFALASCILLGGIYILTRRERLLGLRLIGITAILTFVFMFSYGGFILGDSTVFQIWMSHIQYLAIPFFPVVWFLFSLQQKTNRNRFGAGLYVLLLAIPFLAMITNWLYPATEAVSGTWINHLFFTGHVKITDPQFGSGYNGLLFDKGFFYYFQMGYGMLLTFLSLFNFIPLVKKNTGIGRKRALFLISGASAALFVMLLCFFSDRTAEVDFSPFFSAGVTVTLFFLIFNYELFDLIPQAYRHIFVENNEPLLILNKDFTVISSNKIAKQFFREIHPHLDHSSLPDFEAFDPGISSDLAAKIPHEWKVPNSNPEAWFLVKLMPILKSPGQIMGYTLYYENITAHKNELRQMEYFALYDELTRIRNRRHFFRLATEEFDRSIQKKDKFAIIMFDLDDFKEVNDIYGHQAGDSVLQDLAGIISKELDPENDLFARYGGEEFIIFQKRRTVEEAAKTARKLCAILNGHVFFFEKRSIRTTASFGVSGVQRQIDQSLDSYIKRADDALYQAKKAGKKQVFVYTEPNSGVNPVSF